MKTPPDHPFILSLKGRSKGQWRREGEVRWDTDRVHRVSEGNLRIALQQKSTRQHTHANLTSPDSHSLTFLCLLSTSCALYIYPSSPFLSLCSSLPYPPLSKDSQGCLDCECRTHLWFIQLVNSSCPPVLSASSSLIQCCLLITTEVNIISRSHGRTVRRDSVWFLGNSATCFLLIPNIKRDSRWPQPLFSLQAQCLTVLVMN